MRPGSNRPASSPRPKVSLVDDDLSIRESLPSLIAALGFDVEVFASAEDYLTSAGTTASEILVLDVAMSGMSGPELHAHLKGLGRVVPVVFITALRDAAMRERLLRHGAVDCLFKPFDDVQLSDALEEARSHL